ncbi:MAG: hypothetical protein ACK5Z2_04570 [Bacteroidota bacterium]|jgi:hypothetical protein
MLYNKSPEREQINHFRLFVKSCLDGELKYAGIVNDVIKEARDLAKDKEKIYSISRSYFAVIQLLSEKEKDFLITHQSNKFTNSDYNRILDTLDKKYDGHYW